MNADAAKQTVDALRLDRTALAHRRRLPLWSGAVVGAAALAGWWLWPVGPGTAPRAGSVPKAPAGNALLVRTARVPAAGEGGDIVAGGWIEPAPPAPVVVSTRVTGTLVSCDLLPGDTVAKGGVVAQIDPAPYELAKARAEAAVAVAERRLATLRAGSRPEAVAEAAAALRAADSERTRAEQALDRLKALAPGDVPTAKLEQAQADFAGAVASKEAAAARLALLRAGTRPEVVAEAEAAVALARTQLARAEQELQWCTVRAPVAGTVFERFVHVGEVVSPERSAHARTPGALCTLYDPADLQVRVDVVQADAAKIAVGDRAEVSLAAAPGKRFPGKVLRIDPRGDLAKNTVRVRVKLDAADPALRPELTARVAFGGGEAPVIRIPGRCVVHDGDAALVWQVRAGAAHRVAVTLGAGSGPEVVVLTGLRGGETLVLDPPADLVAGAAVRTGGESR